MRPSEPSALVEVDHAGADDGDGRLGANPRELTFEPLRSSDVVRVEPRDVAPLCLVESPVQGRRETGPLVVPEHDDTRIADRRKEPARVVRRGIVDDDQLEVADALTEDALHGLGEERRAVVDGEQHGHERHGR